MSLFKKVKKQVNKVSWYEVLWKVGNSFNPPLLADFLALKKKHYFCGRTRKFGKPMSDNRCAYNVLKRYYSTTTMCWLKEYVAVFGHEL